MFIFYEKSATQAAYHLLYRFNRPENHIKILHLLYLADRQSLIEVGYPITGAAFTKTLSGIFGVEIYECMKSFQLRYWSNFIHMDYDKLTIINKMKDYDDLSDYNIETLDLIYNKYKSFTYEKLFDEVIQKLPEWNSKSVAISPVEIWKLIGMEEDVIQAYTDQNEYLKQVDIMLNSFR